MSEIKQIRDLVGDYYSSLIDYKLDLYAKMVGKNFLIHLPVNSQFNPIANKVLAAFYHSIAHLSVVDKRYQHFYFDKYQASNRFYLFSSGDELEISFLSARGTKLGTIKEKVSGSNLIKFACSPSNPKLKPFIIKVLTKAEIVEPNYNKQADQIFDSLKKNLASLLTEADTTNIKKARRIRLGRNNNGDIKGNVLNFFQSLKIALPPEGPVGVWQEQLNHSSINWGFKDIEELKALLLLLQNYENQADIMQGQLGLKTIFKRVKSQVENTTKDYETMLELIKELQV